MMGTDWAVHYRKVDEKFYYSKCSVVCLCVDGRFIWSIEVDGAFASPYLQQVFKYGIDFSVHSW